MHSLSARAARPSDPEVTGDVQLVTCVLADQEYGLPIASVREILRVGAITAVPHAPAYMRGVVDLRGRVVPILDLRARLGLPVGESTSRSRVIVVEARARVLGLLVDGVSHVLRLPARALAPAPQEVEAGLAFVRAVATLEQRLILVLDLERALRRDFERVTPGEVGAEAGPA